MVEGDFKFLFSSVAWNFNELESVEKRPGQFKAVSCAYEHHFREIYGDANVVIDKRTVL